MKKLLFLLVLYLVLFINHCESQWVQMSNGMGTNQNVYFLSSSGNNIYAGTYNTSNGIFLSTNMGGNWTQAGFNNYDITALATNGNYVFAGVRKEVFLTTGMYVSTNNGNNWTLTSLDSEEVNVIYISNNVIYAGTYRFYSSNDNGVTWFRTYIPGVTMILSLAKCNNYLFTGSLYNGIYISSNNGVNWTQSSLNNESILSLTVNGNNIYAGTTFGGVYLSTNNGLNWIQTNLNIEEVYTVAISGNNIFAGTASGVYLSKNNGVNWVIKNEGFPWSIPIHTLLINGNYLFGGCVSVWKRPLSDFTGLINISEELPFKYSLEQNYPNPFNPSTNIKYQIVRNSFVKLIVFDALGREVETLVNEKKSPGTYEVTFDGSKLSSGIYFYKLETENFSDVKRMVLVK